ncbi:MAG: serine hydrolase [Oscillospiraceae bacterium]
MKKHKYFSILLSLTLLVQCLCLPVLATSVETTAEPLASQEILPAATEAPAFGTVAMQSGCRTINGQIPLAGSDPRLATAQSVFLYESTTDTVVYAYNPDVKVHPGSLAKILLAMIVLENCEMTDKVKVTEGIQSYIPAGAHKVQPEGLKSNETISVGDLLYATILINANDAAVALAHHVAGTTDAFLKLMNNRAKQLGCVNTQFGNISGLYTAESYSTGRDMAKILREAMKNEDFQTIMKTSVYTIPKTDMVEAREFKTQNYLIDDSTIQDFFNNRVTGGMQSYHEKTGASIACTAEFNGMNFVAVVLGAVRTFAENGWQPLNYGNFNEISELLDYGFSSFKVNRIIYDGMSLSQFVVNGGESYVVGEARVDIDSVVPKSAQMNNLQMNYQIVDGGLRAPIKEGQLIATLQVQYRNSVMAEAEVYAVSPVKAVDATGVTIRSTAVRSDSDDSGILSVIGTISIIILGLGIAYLGFNAYMRSKMRARRRKRRAARRRTR